MQAIGQHHAVLSEMKLTKLLRIRRLHLVGFRSSYVWLGLRFRVRGAVELANRLSPWEVEGRRFASVVKRKMWMTCTADPTALAQIGSASAAPKYSKPVLLHLANIL